MAGYTSRIFLTLTVPSIFGFLSILWFLRKKSLNSKTNNISQDEENTTSVDKHQCQILIPMKLKSHEVVSTQETVCAEMQLKETQSTADAVSNGIKSQKVKAKRKNKSKLPENGNSCAVQEPTTNGCGKDNTSLRNGDSKEELTNGIKALNLRNEVGSKCESSGLILNDACDREENGKDNSITLNCNINGNGKYNKSYADACGLNGIVGERLDSSENNTENSTFTIESLEVAKEQCDIKAQQEGSLSSSCSTNVSLSSIEDAVTVNLIPDSAAETSNELSKSDEPSPSDCNEHSTQQSSSSPDSKEHLSETADVTDSKHLSPVEYIPNGDVTIPIDYVVTDAEENLVQYTEVDANGHPFVNYVMADGLVTLPGSFVPAEAAVEMPESPGAAYCDSLGSNDSGRGASEIQFAVSGSDSSLFYMVYEFEILPEDCGRLIGKNGRNVKYINKQTNANIVIQKHPLSASKKICAVTGTESEIEAALKLIRKRFPLEHFPHVTLAQLNAVPLPVQSPETLKLPLPEGVTFDANLCATVNAGHFFLQQPTHPTFHQLNPLTIAMTSFYNEVLEAPMIDNPVKGNICAAAVSCGWFRAEIEEVYETDECRVKFLDYGGYTTVKLSSIRQIWGDFLQIPFQATECFLAGVMPTDENEWSKESTGAFEELAQGQLLHGCIVAYSENKIPFVNLHRSTGVMNVFINQQLIEAGFAKGIPAAEENKADS